MTYEITWKRDSNAPTPEQEVDATMRQDAVEDILEEQGIDPDDVTYQHPPRHLTADAQPFFTVCSFVLDNVETFIIIYQFLSKDEQNKIVLSDEAKELLERLREDEEVSEVQEENA